MLLPITKHLEETNAQIIIMDSKNSSGPLIKCNSKKVYEKHSTYYYFKA